MKKGITYAVPNRRVAPEFVYLGCVLAALVVGDLASMACHHLVPDLEQNALYKVVVISLDLSLVAMFMSLVDWASQRFPSVIGLLNRTPHIGGEWVGLLWREVDLPDDDSELVVSGPDLVFTKVRQDWRDISFDFYGENGTHSAIQSGEFEATELGSGRLTYTYELLERGPVAPQIQLYRKRLERPDVRERIAGVLPPAAKVVCRELLHPERRPKIASGGRGFVTLDVSSLELNIRKKGGDSQGGRMLILNGRYTTDQGTVGIFRLVPCESVR